MQKTSFKIKIWTFYLVYKAAYPNWNDFEFSRVNVQCLAVSFGAVIIVIKEMVTIFYHNKEMNNCMNRDNFVFKFKDF